MCLMVTLQYAMQDGPTIPKLIHLKQWYLMNIIRANQSEKEIYKDFVLIGRINRELGRH